MRPTIHEAEGVVVERMEMALIVVREELGLPCGHVDVDGAFGFAGFAGEAEIERFVDFAVAPSIGKDIALHHLPEQVGAAAG